MKGKMLPFLFQLWSRLFLFFACLFSAFGVAQNAWNWRNPYPTGHHIYEFAKGTGCFVAADWLGTLIYSNDGYQWESVVGASMHSIKAIVYGKDQFVAVGKDGIILTSTHGKRWTIIPAGILENFTAIAFGNQHYVAISDYKVFTSLDGRVWKQIDFNNQIHLNGITFGDNLFAIVGRETSSNSGVVVTSVNGETWEKTLTGNNPFLGIAYGKDRYVALGNGIFSSSDAKNWDKCYDAKQKISSDYHYIAYIKDFFVVRDVASLLISPDGRQWTKAKDVENWLMTRAITHNGSHYITFDFYGQLCWTKDFTEWETKPHKIKNCLIDVAADENMAVAVGEKGTILASLDGKNWKTVQENKPHDYHAVIKVKDNFVFLAGSNFIGTFSPCSGEVSENFVADENLTGIAYGNQRYVVVGSNGTILYSDDGINWKKATSPTSEHLNAVAYGNNRYVAVGKTDDCIALVSMDGITWQSYPVGHVMLRRITYGCDGFMAVGGSDDFCFSAFSIDGLTWSVHEEFPHAMDLLCVAYDGKSYCAVGSEGYIFCSPDWKNWVQDHRFTNYRFHSVTPFKGTFIAVGWEGAIITRDK